MKTKPANTGRRRKQIDQAVRGKTIECVVAVLDRNSDAIFELLGDRIDEWLSHPEKRSHRETPPSAMMWSILTEATPWEIEYLLREAGAETSLQTYAEIADVFDHSLHTVRQSWAHTWMESLEDGTYSVAEITSHLFRKQSSYHRR